LFCKKFGRLKIWAALRGVPQDNGVGAPATLAKVNELKIKQFSTTRTWDAGQLSVADLDICEGESLFIN